METSVFPKRSDGDDDGDDDDDDDDDVSKLVILFFCFVQLLLGMSGARILEPTLDYIIYVHICSG